MDRTGLKGRRILGRYGPNHVPTAVITRYLLLWLQILGENPKMAISQLTTN